MGSFYCLLSQYFCDTVPKVPLIPRVSKMNTMIILAILSTLFSAVSAHGDGCRCGQANVVCRKHQWMLIGMLGVFCAYLWMYGEYLLTRYCGPCVEFCVRMKAKLREMCGKKMGHDHGHGHSHGHGQCSCCNHPSHAHGKEN